MNYITLSLTISAPDGQEAREDPCQVVQQQDNEDTVPCSGASDLVSELLRMIGFDIPAAEEPEEYRTSIYVKPKNVYTGLNISLSHGNISEPIIELIRETKTVTIMTSDYIELSGGGGYVDLHAKLDLVDTDNISYSKWITNPTDSNLATISPKPPALVDSDNRLSMAQPMNGRLSVNLLSTKTKYDIIIPRREGTEENTYQSSLIIQAEGCYGQPTRYALKVPGCYQQNSWDKYGNPWDRGIEVEHIDQSDKPPEFVDESDVEHEWCLCGNHKWQKSSQDSAAPADAGNSCYPGLPCGDSCGGDKC